MPERALLKYTRKLFQKNRRVKGPHAESKTQQEADKFNEAVSQYKSCIADFVRQEDAAMIHRRAANEAIGEWNDFVTNDMKQ